LGRRYHLRRGPFLGPHRCGTQVTAHLRDTAIAILRLVDWDNIAAVKRYRAHHPE
jgi:hypothetical protein